LRHYMATTPIAHWTKPDDDLYWPKHVVFVNLIYITY
jgi:hypothetical protein